MHIREGAKDELDYDFFFRKDRDSDESGRKIWAIYHGLADHHPCGRCRPTAKILISGIHDMVNIHLGKPVHDSARFEQFLGMVHEAEKHYQKKIIHKVIA